MSASAPAERPDGRPVRPGNGTPPPIPNGAPPPPGNGHPTDCPTRGGPGRAPDGPGR